MLWLSGVFPSNSQLHLEYWNNPILRPPIQKKITLTSAASSKHSTFGEKLHPNFDHVNQASKSYARCGLKPKRLYRTTANWIRFLGGNETNTSMQMIADAAEKQELRGYNGVWNNWSWKTRLACMYIYIYMNIPFLTGEVKKGDRRVWKFTDSVPGICFLTCRWWRSTVSL